MTHLERYQELKNVDTVEALRVLREHIGELPDLRSPNQAEVEAAVANVFPNLLVNEQSKLVTAFLESEETAAALADA